MRRLTILLLSLAATAAPVAATGCGADDVNPDALAQAADATRGKGTMHMTLGGTVEAQGQTIPMKGEGDADLKRKRVHITATTAGQEVETILVDTTMYMRMPGFEDAFGAEWAKIDMAAAGKEMGIDFEQMMQLSSADPAKQLEYLNATSDLEKVGEEEVDGVTTTHYKGETDLRRYPDALPPEEREKARESIENTIELSGSPIIPMEVWIDDDDLVRRQKMTIEQKKPMEMTMNMDMRFSDFGKPVDIEAPKDAKDVTDLATQGIRQGQAGG
ncbi:MAG: LppX_LprAFG lipoprotein [Actinomycetota bacterium]|nr:LppX_LprAFG lipoprotein [Actinomycetota bacterium]